MIDVEKIFTSYSLLPEAEKEDILWHKKYFNLSQ